VLDGPAVYFLGGDGHAQRGAITFPGNDDGAETAVSDGVLLDRSGEVAGRAIGRKLKHLFIHGETVVRWFGD
jgi:hypothetical protein